MSSPLPGFLTLAEPIADAQLARMPELAQRYGVIGRVRCIEDNRFHLSFLAESASLGESSIFVHYVDWARTMLESRGIDADDLEDNLRMMKSLIESSELDLAEPAVRVLDDALGRFSSLGEEPSSFLEGALPLAQDYLDALLAGRHRDSRILVEAAADSGLELPDLYLRVFEPVQQEVGRLWQLNRISVAQEHFCTAATQSAMAQLYPRFLTGDPGRRRLVATCAGQELHEIGLRMVTDLLEIDGWDTQYLGSNIPLESILTMLRKEPPAALAVSATIAGNLGAARTLIEGIRGEPALESLPILIGGYPFRISQRLTRLIGADASASDARGAVEAAARFADA